MKNEICQKLSIVHYVIIHNIHLAILYWKINNDSIVDNQIRPCDFLIFFFFQCHVYYSWLPLIGLSLEVEVKLEEFCITFSIKYFPITLFEVQNALMHSNNVKHVKII
jgi:hypothetical protein